MSAQIKSNPREAYKFSENQINNDVNCSCKRNYLHFDNIFPYYFTMPRVSSTLQQIKHLRKGIILMETQDPEDAAAFFSRGLVETPASLPLLSLAQQDARI